MSIRADILTVSNTRGILSGKMMFSIALFIFGLVLFFVFIIPSYRNMKILMLEEGLRTANLDKKNQTLNKMRSFERKVGDVSDNDIEKIKMFIPTDNKIEFQLSNLDILARVMKVELSDLVIGAAANASKGKQNQSGSAVKLLSGEARPVSYGFQVKGSYGDILAFVHSIERNVPMFKIGRIEIGVEKKKTVKNEADGAENNTNKTVVASISMMSYNY